MQGVKCGVPERFVIRKSGHERADWGIGHLGWAREVVKLSYREVKESECPCSKRVRVSYTDRYRTPHDGPHQLPWAQQERCADARLTRGRASPQRSYSTDSGQFMRSVKREPRAGTDERVISLRGRTHMSGQSTEPGIVMSCRIVSCGIVWCGVEVLRRGTAQLGARPDAHRGRLKRSVEAHDPSRNVDSAA